MIFLDIYANNGCKRPSYDKPPPLKKSEQDIINLSLSPPKCKQRAKQFILQQAEEKGSWANKLDIASQSGIGADLERARWHRFPNHLFGQQAVMHDKRRKIAPSFRRPSPFFLLLQMSRMECSLFTGLLLFSRWIVLLLFLDSKERARWKEYWNFEETRKRKKIPSWQLCLMRLPAQPFWRELGPGTPRKRGRETLPKFKGNIPCGSLG